jgi:hypothetical protein
VPLLLVSGSGECRAVGALGRVGGGTLACADSDADESHAISSDRSSFGLARFRRLMLQAVHACTTMNSSPS